MSPRRLRNSMILVAIIEPVGIGEPRRSRTASAGTVATLAVGSAGVLIPGPQPTRNLQEPRSSDAWTLKPIHRDTAGH